MNTSKSFIVSILDGKLNNDEIIDTYLIINKSSADNIKFVHVQLQALRDLIKEKSVDKNDLTYVPYSTKDFPELKVTEEMSSQIIIIKNKKERLLPILFTGDKINSFTTMNKGGKRIFINF